MVKKIIKPQFYSYNPNSDSNKVSGYLFLSHIPAEETEKNKTKDLLTSYTSFYVKSGGSLFDSIQILDKNYLYSVDEMYQHIFLEYDLQKTDYTINTVIDKDNIVIYAILLDKISDKFASKYTSNPIIEMVPRKRLTETENYWGLLSTGISSSRKKYLNNRLHSSDKDVKLEIRFKKVYKALIGI